MEPSFAYELALLHMRVGRAITEKKQGLHYATLGKQYAEVATQLNPLHPGYRRTFSELSYMCEEYAVWVRYTSCTP